MPLSKQEAYLKRGGHEMRHIMSNEAAKRSEYAKRPATVADFDFFKYGHSLTLSKHNTEVCDKFGPRDRPILKQRYVGYPVAVPDLSRDSSTETTKRRSIHKSLLQDDMSMFRKKFFQECTTDYFNQKHLIRDYLNTMHPYSDPLDKGRTYSQSRLVIREKDLPPLPMGDFLQPEDMTRPRSTGYNSGHVRSMLKLDNFGPEAAKRNRLAREVGMLPETPNVDREKAIESASRSSSPLPFGGETRPESPGNSTVSTVEDPEEEERWRRRMQRRPHTTKDETADMYVPDMAMARGVNYQSNNQEIPGPDYSHVPIQGEGKEMEGAEVGLMPDQKSPPVSRGSSRKDKRAQTANAIMGFNSHDEDDDENKSKKSQTSRGGYKPTKPPHNPNTQTGVLGYHGKAVGEAELLMLDPIRRGKEWSAKQTQMAREKSRKAVMKASFRNERLKVREEIEQAKYDFRAFEKALEFRRTAKPADLPENNTRRAKQNKK